MSRLGFGTGQIGGDDLTDDEAGRILGHVLDAGVTVLDTARGYGLAEERIGKLVAHRRSEFVLSTKVGYGVEGFEDWSPEIIEAGIHRALKLMCTDVLDIVHLHSCPLEVLQNSGVAEALSRAVSAGTIRVAAYSGENEALTWAIESGLFGSLQCSVNVCDQGSLLARLPAASSRGMGVIAKRPLANAYWRYKECPTWDSFEVYWHRGREMDLSPGEMDWADLAIRFAAFAPGVHTSIVATKNLAHFDENVASVARGPLPEESLAEIGSKFDPSWPGLI